MYCNKIPLNQNMSKKGIYILLIVLIKLVPVFSQNIFLKNLSNNLDEISSDNYRLKLFRNNSVWLCSESGIINIAGDGVKSYTMLDGLKTNDNWNLDEDSQGRVWLSNYFKGIQYIQDGKVFDLEGSSDFYQIFYSGENNDTLFFNVLDGGISRYYWVTGQPLLKYEHSPLAGYTEYARFKDKGMTLLSKRNGTKQSYALFNSKNDSLVTYGAVSFKALCETNIKHETQIILKTENGIKSICSITDDGIEPIKAFLNDSHEDFVFTDEYVIRKNRGGELYEIRNGLKRDKNLERVLRLNLPEGIGSIGSLLKDSFNNIWVNNLRGQAYFIHADAFLVSDYVEISSNHYSEDIVDLQCIRHGKYYLFSNHKNQIGYYDSELKSKSILFQLYGPIRKFIERSGKLYVLTTSRLVVIPIKLKEERVSLVLGQIRNIPLNENAFTFSFMEDNTLLLSSGSELDLVTEKITKSKNPYLVPNRSTNLFYSDSVVLFSNNFECSFYDVPRKKSVTFNIPFVIGVRMVNGFVFVLSKYNGLYLLNRDKEMLIRCFPFKVSVNDIDFFNGDYVLSTNEGLLVCELDVDDRLSVKKSYFSNVLSGVDIKYVTFINQPVLFTSKGVLYLGNNSQDKFVVPKVRMLFRDASLNEIKQNEVLPIENTFVSVRLEYGALLASSHLWFRYRHNDVEWIYLSKNSFDLKNLSSGLHALVIECSEEGRFGEYTFLDEFNFAIEEPFFRTAQGFLMLLGLFLLIAGFIYLFIRLYLLRIKHRKSMMIDLKYKALQAQLNPHFVFNCLNTIQSISLLKSEKKLNEYIGVFSDLMRKVLDSSKEKKFSLQNEITLLEDYLYLEKFRLGEGLRCELIVEDIINTSEVMVHGMVFQPIVENAAVHAFISGQDEKMIKVKFVLDGEYLVGSVEDNGIGRKHASLLSRKKTYKSWSSKILSEKSELLNKYRKDEISIKTIDLPKGTKVIVRMRLNNTP